MCHSKNTKKIIANKKKITTKIVKKETNILVINRNILTRNSKKEKLECLGSRIIIFSFFGIFIYS